MAIVDLAFNAWVEEMRTTLPQAFHDLTASRQPNHFRLDIARMAFAAGRAAQRDAALAQQVGAVGGEVCTWTCTDHPYEGVTWDSTCGVKYCFTEDGPEENGHKFCHSCGKPMSVLNIASSAPGGGGEGGHREGTG